MVADRKQRRRNEDGKILQAHGHRFRKMTQNVVVDATMCSKLYGTVAVKGDATPDRPPRRAELDPVPTILEPVDRETLAALAEMAPVARLVSGPMNGKRPLPPLDLVGLPLPPPAPHLCVLVGDARPEPEGGPGDPRALRVQHDAPVCPSEPRPAPRSRRDPGELQHKVSTKQGTIRGVSRKSLRPRSSGG